ncbi:MAG: N-acetylmuramoyl-L-alanine amidase [Fimbriimonadaceae bacterium]|nr:N-acetylmuramoyl-L-alanine amidase [Fimbriimonadaceae bacterium]
MAAVPLLFGLLALFVQSDGRPYGLLEGNPQDWKDPGYLQIVWAESPNFGPRPADAVIDTIVLHHTANTTLGGVVRWFATTESQVSSHYTIGKDGSIAQHVSTFDRAWHAGKSVDKFGRENLNNFTVGIEMVNKGDGEDKWTDEQVEAVRLLILSLKRRFPLKYITTHEYIAVPKGRKNDPKNFPWEKLYGTGLEIIR